MKDIDLSNTPEAPMPRVVKPMLATLVQEPFDREGWLFEIKWDGYRSIALSRKDGAELYSRNWLLQNSTYSPVAKAMASLGFDAVFDGEIVVLDENGISKFQLLQNYENMPSGGLRYFVFDILHLKGHDLQNLPLIRRKEILRSVLPDDPIVRYCDHVETHGIAFFKLAADQGLEGVIGKRMDSVYRQGVRSKDWLKVRSRPREEFIIGGFTEPRGSRQHIGAFLLGFYQNGDLIFAGHASGRLGEADLARLRKRLEPSERKDCPFVNCPKTNMPAHWVEPELVVEVEFSGWTEEGHMRQPIILGLREDKPATEVRRYPAVEPPPKEEPLSFTNLQKVYWPEEGYTKGDLISHYRRVSKFILPHLKDRPQSLHRHPEGIYGESFYHKNVGDIVPDWIPTVTVYSEGEQRDVVYMLCQEEAALLYMANLGCIEINPWLSHVGSLDNPDYVVIDLDPDGSPFENVVDSTLAVKQVLDEVGIVGYPKTSGGKGIHVYIPLGAKYTYEQGRQFTLLLVLMVNKRIPEISTIERSVGKRGGKVYLDYLQNRRGQTLAAAYCVRPFQGAPVSTPLYWEEINRNLNPLDFNIRTIEKRLEQVGDIFMPVLGHGIDLRACVEKIGSI